MATYGQKDIKLLVHSKDATCEIDALNFKVSAVLDEFLPICSAWPVQYDTGQRRAEIGCSGIYNSVSGATPVLADLTGTGRVVTLAHEGGTAGSRCWCLRSATVSEVELVFDTEKVDRLAPAFAISGNAHQGYVVAPLVARTTAGNLDADDADGAASSTTTQAFLHVTALDLGGGSALTVTVRSSADADTWADCSPAFTNVTAVGSEWITLSGTVERYLSIKWAWTGGSNQSFTGFVAVARD